MKTAEEWQREWPKVAREVRESAKKVGVPDVAASDVMEECFLEFIRRIQADAAGTNWVAQLKEFSTRFTEVLNERDALQQQINSLKQ
jgi:hypothetical protein